MAEQALLVDQLHRLYIPCVQVAPLLLPLDAGGTAYEGYLLSNVGTRLAAAAQACSCVSMHKSSRRNSWGGRTSDACRPSHALQVQRAAGRPASLWLRLSGLHAGAPSLAGAQLEVNAELAALLQGCDMGAVLAQRLAEARSLTAFVVELQSMVDTLSLGW